MFFIKAQLQNPTLLLKNCPLFAGLSETELDWLLPLTKPEFCCYQKGDLVAAWGEPTRPGIVAEGVIISTLNLDSGPSHALEVLEQGDLLGVDAALSHAGPNPTNLIAGENSSILFFDLTEPLERAEPEVKQHLLSNVNQVLASRCMKLLFQTEALMVENHSGSD